MRLDMAGHIIKSDVKMCIGSGSFLMNLVMVNQEIESEAGMCKQGLLITWAYRDCYGILEMVGVVVVVVMYIGNRIFKSY